jgi:uncharacterized protein
MNAVQNKQIMQKAYAELAKGNGKPFVDLLADDFCWTTKGTTNWSKTYRGKRAVLDDLMKPLFAQFADRYTNTAQRIIAEDDYVVVECRGRVTLKSGKPYSNEYCLVIRMKDGKMQELTEYLDTELVTASLT